MPTDDELDGGEIVMSIEALDALIPFSDETRRVASETDRQVWARHDRLRARLKEAIHMSFYDRADTWLSREPREERFALTENLHSRLVELLRQPGASRRTVPECFVKAVQELRETLQSKPRP